MAIISTLYVLFGLYTGMGFGSQVPQAKNVHVYVLFGLHIHVSLAIQICIVWPIHRLGTLVCIAWPIYQPGNQICISSTKPMLRISHLPHLYSLSPLSFFVCPSLHSS